MVDVYCRIPIVLGTLSGAPKTPQASVRKKVRDMYHASAGALGAIKVKDGTRKSAAVLRYTTLIVNVLKNTIKLINAERYLLSRII
mmetsp:Transcript_6268/g.10754  ORF Transcript_6268/g.10754 Transcript_6268/m.10754 type:complete len:86 (-) Transcript_6268:168-425(-)